MISFQHIILTRFNVRLDPNDENTVPSEEWLEHRFNLFEQYTLPSLEAQSNQNFKWFVFFDELTPQIFKDRITEISKFNPFTPFYVIEILPDLKQLIEESLTPDINTIVTTRLDNDDVLHKSFVSEVQSRVTSNSKKFINFTNGYSYSENKLYTNFKPSNPFITLIESRTEYTSVWCGVEHTAYNTVAPIDEINIEPMWLQMIHETNLRNQIHAYNKVQPTLLLKDKFVTQAKLISESEGAFIEISDTNTTIPNFTHLTATDFELLTRSTFPWEPNSIEYIQFTHSFERIIKNAEQFKTIMNQLLQSCKPNSILKIESLHMNNSQFHHNNMIFLTNAHFQNVAGFNLVKSQTILNENWARKFQQGTVNESGLVQASQVQNDVFHSSQFELIKT